MSAVASIAGKKITSARVCLPAWGAWYADVATDGEVTLSGQVTITIADLTLIGTILSGGSSTGRSHFRVVGGKGGWGKKIAKKSYANDAGVKLVTVLSDAASDAGESLDTTTIDNTARIGPGFTRPEDQACRLLELYAAGAWYVGEDGVTRVGSRTAGALPAHVTRTTPIDKAAGVLELASESIATILPGLIVDGLTAVDVVHEISAKGGLRSTIYGRLGGTTSRRLEAMRKIQNQLDPRRKFRSLWEYRIVSFEGNRVNLQPVLVSTGMPDLRRVAIRPGVAGIYGTAALGSRVIVGFVNEDPGRAYVASFEDIDGDGFNPTALDLYAGGQVSGEHVATIEATALLIYNVIAALCTASPGPWTGAGFQSASIVTLAINAALAAQATPAPPGAVLQAALAATQASNFVGTLPAQTAAPFVAAIAAMAKTPNASGLFPSLGAAKVRAG